LQNKGSRADVVGVEEERGVSSSTELSLGTNSEVKQKLMMPDNLLSDKKISFNKDN